MPGCILRVLGTLIKASSWYLWSWGISQGNNFLPNFAKTGKGQHFKENGYRGSKLSGKVVFYGSFQNWYYITKIGTLLILSSVFS